MIAEFGHAALWLAASLGVLQAILAGLVLRGIAGISLADIGWIALSRSLLAAFALGALCLLFVRTDLSVVLVAELSNTAWPISDRLTAFCETGEGALLAGVALTALGGFWASKWTWGWSRRARAFALGGEALVAIAAYAALLNAPPPFARMIPAAPEGLGRGLHLTGEGLSLHLPLFAIGAAMLAFALVLLLPALAGAVEPAHRNRAIRPWASGAWSLLAPAAALAWVAGGSAGLLGTIAACWLGASFLLWHCRGLKGHSRRSAARIGMPLAMFGAALVLVCTGLASSRFRQTNVVLRAGETVIFRPWQLTVRRISPAAGPNWTALEGEIAASWDNEPPVLLKPQARSYLAPQVQASTWAEADRGNGRLRAAFNGTRDPDRWVLHLVWQPFVQLITLGGWIAALGGLLMAASHGASLVRRARAREMLAYRHWRQGR